MRFKFLKKLLSPRRFSCSNTTINIDALEAQSQKLLLYVQFRDTVSKINNKVCMTLPSETSASPLTTTFPSALNTRFPCNHATLCNHAMHYVRRWSCFGDSMSLCTNGRPAHCIHELAQRTMCIHPLWFKSEKRCHKKALFIAQNTQIELYSPMVIVGQKCPPLSP